MTHEKELLELLEGKSMIVSRVFPDLDRKVAISLVTFLICGLVEEVPVCHIQTASSSYPSVQLPKHLDAFSTTLQVVEGRKEHYSIIRLL